ncbi:unnamed protein product [Heterobilharzia americana]|nr:unnamed protein product [Heterobilharzia americana]CAH8645157.1 unnamed protein product [Heterobilharzia americana]
MFSSGCNLTKLRTNIKLCIQRLEYVQKKKSEISKKNRRDIADLLKDGKIDRARIKVEQIIRDDYCVEAMDIIQSYLETINERFGLVQDSKLADASLETPIATVLWCKSRMKNEIKELDVIFDQLSAKFGKSYVHDCCEKATMVNRTVMSKLNSIVPGANLVEMYLVEIAKSYDVPFVPDTHVILDNNVPGPDDNLIEFKSECSGGLPSIPPNFGACSMPWPTPSMSEKAPYPTDFINDPGAHPSMPPSEPSVPGTKTNEDIVMPPPYDITMSNDQSGVMPYNYGGAGSMPPQNSFGMLPPQDGFNMLPPMNRPDNIGLPDDEKADFESLAERFERLKKK